MFHVFLMLVCVIFFLILFICYLFFLIPCDFGIYWVSNILCRKTNVIRRRSWSSLDFFKNKIGTKSCNSRHFRWIIVAQKEDRLSFATN